MTGFEDVERLRDAWATAREALLAERTADGYWVGRLSSSALSTATAVSALVQVDRVRHAELIDRGARWLASHQNTDGGWGDTTDSPSHLATTMLCQAALTLAGSADGCDCLDRAERWIAARAGADRGCRIDALRELYGADRTFAVPIQMNCALAGLAEWSAIPRLPFELACVPHRWLRLMRAHVVSYALPALIAIGQLLHQKHPTRFPPARLLRDRAVAATLRKLQAIQPATGGFIEAVPLTSFVVMSLAAAGRGDHPVAVAGVEFLSRTARDDGSWPIDSNLSVWLTTLSVKALAAGPEPGAADLRPTLQWIAEWQHAKDHPYTQTSPGGWAWTHLAGGVPDADDTAGALLALGAADGGTFREAAAAGAAWLLDLQNSDGGWPTFCRGWGRLPFDRSAADLTAHAIRALHHWRTVLGAPQLSKAVDQGLAYLGRVQGDDGSWTPLWFGNQHVPGHVNPVIGTARVLAAYRDLGAADSPQARRGVRYLLAVQGDDGGWGGAAGVTPSVEETAVAVEGLAGWVHMAEVCRACVRGGRWLARCVESGAIDTPTPIGLYFTKLWYSERLYPLIWTTGALGRLIRAADGRSAANAVASQTETVL